ncbi:hypothetical protein HHK36_022968 [Tetracentron sinense]|uniref:Uncharacterized protein n=1 Tax=Tetracentron sinense TaxID=13715 RepID=A0A834YS20_TETSI|nr:hypothetical protein HHK36_022968 [Tetracentron sinense]
MLEENIPPRSRDIRQKAKDTKKSCAQSRSPLGYLSLQDQNIGAFVPPLRHPPKSAMGQFGEMQGSYNPYKLDVSQKNFQYQKHIGLRYLGIEHERENLIHEPGRQLYHNSKIMDVNFLSHQYERHILPNELHIKRERENMVRENRRRNFSPEDLMGQSMKATHNVRTLKRSAAHEELEWENVDSNYEIRKFCEKKLVGPPFLNHGRGCRPADENDWEIMEGEYGRRDDVGENLMGPPPISTPRNGGGRWGHLGSNMDKTGFEGNNYNYSRVRYVNEEIEWEKMEYENERRSFAGKFVDHSMGTVGDGGGVEIHHNLKMGNAGSGRNYKKRGMKSGSDNSRYHQRKRR